MTTHPKVEAMFRAVFAYGDARNVNDMRKVVPPWSAVEDAIRDLMLAVAEEMDRHCHEEESSPQIIVDAMLGKEAT